MKKAVPNLCMIVTCKYLFAISSILFFAEYGSAQTDASFENKFSALKDSCYSTELVDHNLSFLYADSALNMAEEANSDYHKADALLLKGGLFFIENNADSALYYTKRAVDIFEIYQDSVAYQIACYNLGNIYLDKGEYVSALINFQKILKNIENYFSDELALNDMDVLGSLMYTYSSIADIYRGVGDHVSSKYYVSKMQTVIENTEIELPYDFQFLMYFERFQIAMEENKFQDAVVLIDKALENNHANDDHFQDGSIYREKARLMNALNKTDEALFYLDVSDSIYSAVGNRPDLILNSIVRSEIFNKTKKFTQSLDVLYQNINSIDSVPSKIIVLDYYQQLALTCNFSGKTDSMVYYFQVMNNVNADLRVQLMQQVVDELVNYIEDEEERIQARTEDLRLRYDNDKLKIQMEGNKRLQKRNYFIFFITILFLATVVFVFWNLNRKNKKVNHALNRTIEDKQILFKEMHHRVKNNFQIMSSLFSLQHMSTDDKGVTKVLGDAQSRIQTMALVHEMLYKKNEVQNILFSAYVTELITSIIHSLNDENKEINFTVKAGNESFDLQIATSLGLILNEAFTNAVKYAFKSRESGQIDISLESLGHQKYRLTIQDNGIGIPEEIINGKRETLGVELIHILSEQLGGHAEIKKMNGTIIVVVFNADN
ncbi:MAG: sensor histidine kinase [Crocinitomicaceae bacterium]|nr:sensor histidine kinase [Crocinitomicaceae bacterium]MBK8924910.1 sensor histidine kinase [Crocinitomicaceae bacterium]